MILSSLVKCQKLTERLASLGENLLATGQILCAEQDGTATALWDDHETVTVDVSDGDVNVVLLDTDTSESQEATLTVDEWVAGQPAMYDPDGDPVTMNALASPGRDALDTVSSLTAVSGLFGGDDAVSLDAITTVLETENSTDDTNSLVQSLASVADEDGRVSNASWLSLVSDWFSNLKDNLDHERYTMDNSKPTSAATLLDAVVSVGGVVVSTAFVVLGALFGGIAAIAAAAIGGLIQGLSNFSEQQIIGDVNPKGDSDYVDGPALGFYVTPDSDSRIVRLFDDRVQEREGLAMHSFAGLDVFSWPNPREKSQAIQGLLALDLHPRRTVAWLAKVLDRTGTLSRGADSAIFSYRPIVSVDTTLGALLDHAPDEVRLYPAERARMLSSNSYTAYLARFAVACVLARNIKLGYDYPITLAPEQSLSNLPNAAYGAIEPAYHMLLSAFFDILWRQGDTAFLADAPWASAVPEGYVAFRYQSSDVQKLYDKASHPYGSPFRYSNRSTRHTPIASVSTYSNGDYVRMSYVNDWEATILTEVPGALRFNNSDIGDSMWAVISAIPDYDYSVGEARTVDSSLYDIAKLPAKRRFTWPSIDLSTIITAGAIVAGAVLAVAVTKNAVSRFFARKRAVNQTRRLDALNKLRARMLDNPGDAQARKDYGKAVVKYNRLANFLHWGTYDPANGWMNSPSSVLPQSISSPSTAASSAASAYSTSDDIYQAIFQAITGGAYN